MHFSFGIFALKYFICVEGQQSDPKIASRDTVWAQQSRAEHKLGELRRAQIWQLKMTEVYESFYELKVNGREVLLVDEKKYTYKKARGYSGVKVILFAAIK